MLVLIKIS